MPHPARLLTDPASGEGPIRTCVGCGKRQARADLIRVVATHEGSVSIDSRRDLPGRGAWLHPDSVCVEKARHRRSFQRALRIRADIGEDAWDNLEKIAQQATAKTSTID